VDSDEGRDRVVSRLLAFVPLLALLLCLYAVDLPFFVESPGQAKSVLPLIDVDGTPTYDSEGKLLLTTVNIGRVNVYHAVRAWLDPAANLVSERDLIPPGESDVEYERRSFSQMDQSKIAAVAVALSRFGDYPELRGPGVIVQDSVQGTPAAGRLFPGDLLVAADGTPINDPEHLTQLLAEAGAGARIDFTVRPLEGGEEEVVPLRPIQDPADPSRTIIGILSVANFPFTVRIESGEIGGPSAGLMWALGVSELLTSDDLTGDRTLAGTGTVDLEGNVGPIGGILLKIEAAERAGASVFLLPQDNMAEARDAETDLRLVPVTNVDQAVAFLEGAA
jgi:PDZ domain-containing protein